MRVDVPAFPTRYVCLWMPACQHLPLRGGAAGGVAGCVGGSCMGCSWVGVLSARSWTAGRVLGLASVHARLLVVRLVFLFFIFCLLARWALFCVSLAPLSLNVALSLPAFKPSRIHTYQPARTPT